jgi:ATP-dependent RNA helicase DeaD
MISFKDLGVSPELIQGIEALGFKEPMPIQEKVIPVMLAQKKDLVGLAQTGTGKTAAFGLPILQKLDLSKKIPQALILCPTRELCIQISNDLISYAKKIKGVRILAVYGGASIEVQIKELKKGSQVIVATPGRLLDLINRGRVDVSSIDFLVLDEADEMLNMGFKEELTSILVETPETKIVYLFSATMPQEVAKIAAGYMKNPIEIIIGRRNAGAENVRHIYYSVQAHDRYLALKRIIDYNPDIYGIVFCRTRIETKEIAEKLIQDGYNADALHGDLSQAQRDYVMKKFRNKTLQIIVATDVAARGLDVSDLTHIINYQLPDELQIYTHRSGRTGRAGKRGVSIAIVHQKETYKIRHIEKKINKKFEYHPVPEGRAICEKQLFNIIDRMERVDVDDSQIDPYLNVICKKLEWLDKEQLIKQFVALEFNRFLSYYKNAPDLNVPKVREGKKDKKYRMNQVEMTRFFLNQGKKDDLAPLDLIGMINDATGIRNIEIGKIDIFNSFSFFEADKNYTEKILYSFKNHKINNKRVNVEIAAPKEDGAKKTEKSRFREKNQKSKVGLRGSFMRSNKKWKNV